MPSIHDIVLFDGYCNFCSGIARWILRYDHRDRFRLAASQSEAGQRLLAAHDLADAADRSIILVEKDRVYRLSSAALRVARRLGGAWPALYVLVIVPRFVRDGLYRWFARHRYRWFGRRATCFLPGEKHRHKFL